MIEKKDLVDMLSKNADVVYKKLIVFLASAGGSGAYAIKFLQDSDLSLYGILFSIIFLLLALGILENFLRIKKIEKSIEEIIYD